MVLRGLRERLDSDRRVALLIKRGADGRFRYTARDSETGRYVAPSDVRGFASFEEAEEFAASYYNVASVNGTRPRRR